MEEWKIANRDEVRCRRIDTYNIALSIAQYSYNGDFTENN